MRRKQECYKSTLALCPMYVEETASVVFCSGIQENTSIHIGFGNKADAKDYKRDYCKSSYKACPIYKMIIKEGGYDDDG